MYTVYADGKCIYAPNTGRKELALSTPKITFEKNKAGKFEFTMPKSNIAYNDLKKLMTIITVYDDDTEIWRGRVLNDTANFYNEKKVVCEGELAFLNDGLVMPYDYDNTYTTQTLKKHFDMIVNEGYYDKCSKNRKIHSGIIASRTVNDVVVNGDTKVNANTVKTNSALSDNDFVVKSENHQNPLSVLLTMIDKWGGYLKIRNDSTWGRVIDWLADDSSKASQEIIFGKNMLDLSKYINAEDVFTVLYAYGSDTDSYGDHYSLNYNGNVTVNGGLEYIENKKGIDLFGRINKVLYYDGLQEPREIKEAALPDLEKSVEAAITITINAADLHLLNPDIKTINLCDWVHVVSEPHGIDENYQCTKITLDMENPTNTKYEIGSDSTSVSSRQNATSSTASSAAATADKAASDVVVLKNDMESIKVGKLDADVAKITYATITDLTATNEAVETLKANSLTADSAIITTLQTDKANVTDLNATNETVKNLEANKANVTDLNATNETVKNLSADKADITDLNATNETVKNLEANKANVTDLNATNETVKSLEATKADIDDLNAINADIDTLNATTGNIETLLSGQAGVGTLQAIHLSSDNVVIADATITDAMIADLSADKITAGTIYTSIVKIASDQDENILIDGSTIQIRDTSGIVRIQIGKDDDGDYSMYIWGKDGTLLWQPTGITGEGIGNGTIKNVNVANDAAIDGSKLNIRSVASALNDDGSLVVDSANVTVDDKTLSVAYKEVVTNISNVAETSKADLEAYKEIVTSDVTNLQNQIDGAIATFTGSAVPTLNNYPASDWTDNAERDKHIGDLFIVDSNGEDNAGFLYRFMYDSTDSTYKWVNVPDNEVQKAIKDSQEALNTANQNSEKISTIETDLSVVQGQINSKIWQTDIETATNGLATSEEFKKVSDQYSTLNQTVSGIETEVGNVQTTLNTKADSSDVINLTSQVSKLEQTVDGFTSTVTKDNIISTINQSAEEVTIDANKISINGLVKILNKDSNVLTGLNTLTEFGENGIWSEGTWGITQFTYDNINQWYIEQYSTTDTIYTKEDLNNSGLTVNNTVYLDEAKTFCNHDYAVTRWWVEQYSTSDAIYTKEALASSGLAIDNSRYITVPSAVASESDEWMNLSLKTYYTIYAKTYMYFREAQTYTTTIYHDDQITVYLNDSVIYTKDAWCGGSALSITFNFVKGFNKVEIVLHNINGGHGFYFTTILPYNEMSADPPTMYDTALTYDYVLHAQTYLYFKDYYSLNTAFYHDDGASVYVNDNLYYSNDTFHAYEGNSGHEPSSIQLYFEPGWNKVEVVLQQGLGGNGFYFGESLSSICEIMTADPDYENNPIYSIYTDDTFSEYNNLNIFSFKFYNSGTSPLSIWQSSIETNPNEKYILSCYARSDIDSTVTLSATIEGEDVKQSFDLTKDSDWTFLEMPITASEEAYISFEISGQENGYVYIGAPRLIREADEDSSVTYIDGNKIITGTIVTDKLAAGSITTDKIAAGAITADQIKAKTIMAENIMDEQIFKKLATFNDVGTNFPAQSVPVASDFAHYVIQFAGYNPSSGYYCVTNGTAIVPSDGGEGSVAITSPALCANIDQEIYLDEISKISIYVSYGGSVSVLFNETKGTTFGNTCTVVNKKDTSSTNIGTTVSINSHTRLKALTINYGIDLNTEVKNTINGVYSVVYGGYYNFSSSGSNGDLAIALEGSSWSTLTNYASGWNSGYGVVTVKYYIGYSITDDTNTSYALRTKTNYSSSSVTDSSSYAYTYTPRVKATGTFTLTIPSSITITMTDGSTKSVSIPITSSISNLNTNASGSVSRSISTQKGLITIGRPYSVSGSTITYLTDYKLLYPRAIYGVR